MQDVQPHRAPLELPHPVPHLPALQGSDETDIGYRVYDEMPPLTPAP
ncbi:hypothetical protein SMICM17S_04093 [Streptomyces microflavus]